MAVAPLEQPVQPSLSMPTPVVRKRQAPRRRSVPTPSATPPPSPVAAPVVPVAQQQQQVQGVQPTAVPTPVVRRRQTPRKKPTPVATPPPSPVATPVPIMAVAPLEQPVQPSLSMPTPVVRKRQAPRRRSVPTPSATPPPSPVAAPVVPVAQQQQQVQGVQPTAVPTPVVRRRQTPRKKPTPVATPLPSVAEKEQEQFPATKSVMTEQEEQSTPPPAPVARRKQQPRKRQTSSPPPLPTAVEVPGVEESPNTPPSPPPTPVVRKRQPLMVHEEMLPYVLVEEEEDEDGGKVELQQPASQPSPVVPASSVGKSEAVDEPVSDEHTSMTGNTEGPDSTLPPAFLAVVEKKSGVVPDHREKVLTVFQKLSDINIALQERYKAHSYQFALERLKRDDYIYTHLPPHIMPPGVDDAERRRRVAAVEAIPNIGDKLKTKIVEILTTGDLEELHGLQAKPVIKAIRELTQIHGVGPRTAVVLFKKYGLKTVEEVEKRIREQEAAQASSGVAGSDGKTNKGGAKKGRGGKVADGEVPLLQLTEAQRCGLKYHSDFAQRIPHEEVRLHEAFLKLRLRKYLGKSYELSICGSYRRRLPTSGDIDVLLTRRMGSKDASDGEDDETAGDVQDVKPQEVLAAFVDALKKEHYIEATLAQGATKFMGVSRLKSYGYNTDSASPKMYPARRLDIRFVEPECFPAALLYFTGSKTFNVVMRAEAIKQNFVLNEYGLFHNELPNDSASSLSGEGGASASRSFSRGHWNAEAFQKLVRAHYYSSKSPALAENNDGSVDVEVDDDLDAADSGEGVKGGRRVSAASQKQKEQQQRELHALWQEVEARRVKVRHERDIFAALGMPYVLPEHRSM
ncbi:putative DNA polymerase beta palm DNA polymerase beta thumb [Trypanosoma vivax]|nr:putative DNA polymerase beta palm DNA polymerase beta thumb [Trypanosoma vivax]